MVAEFNLFSGNGGKKDLLLNVPLFHKSALKKSPKGINYVLGLEEGAEMYMFRLPGLSSIAFYMYMCGSSFWVNIFIQNLSSKNISVYHKLDAFGHLRMVYQRGKKKHPNRSLVNTLLVEQRGVISQVH